MSNILDTIEGLIETNGQFPPVESWNPKYCGDSNMEIKANGEWYHEGKPINRKKMARLFSTIIKKENEDYFLVTPVEKLALTVEWQPFVIVDFSKIRDSKNEYYLFTDNFDNRIPLDQENQICLSNFQDLSLPTVKARRNLYASFSRNCYYRLIEEANITERNCQFQVEIISSGILFNIGETEID